MIVTAPGYHVPVLLKESVDGLQISPEGIYVDVTFGGGGHSREILSRLGSKGHLYSFDQDADAEQNIPCGMSKSLPLFVVTSGIFVIGCAIMAWKVLMVVG